MVVYGVALLPLVEITRTTDKGVLAPFYADNVALDGPADRNAQLLDILVKHGPNFGYFPEPEKIIHVCNNAEEVEQAREAFKARGLTVILHDRYRYVGGYIRDREREVEWVKPNIEAWVEGVKVLAGFAG
eukprot:10531197-Ditylum_brightwellii.AAC.2